jgi:hypothetical protein
MKSRLPDVGKFSTLKQVLRGAIHDVGASPLTAPQ